MNNTKKEEIMEIKGMSGEIARLLRLFNSYLKEWGRSPDYIIVKSESERNELRKLFNEERKAWVQIRTVGARETCRIYLKGVEIITAEEYFNRGNLLEI